MSLIIIIIIIIISFHHSIIPSFHHSIIPSFHHSIIPSFHPSSSSSSSSSSPSSSSSSSWHVCYHFIVWRCASKKSPASEEVTTPHGTDVCWGSQTTATGIVGGLGRSWVMLLGILSGTSGVFTVSICRIIAMPLQATPARNWGFLKTYSPCTSMHQLVSYQGAFISGYFWWGVVFRGIH